MAKFKTDEYSLFQSKLNKFLKEKREAKGLSTYTLAKELGIVQSTYFMYEYKSLPPINMLIKLMAVLDFTFEDVKKLYDETIEEMDQADE